MHPRGYQKVIASIACDLLAALRLTGDAHPDSAARGCRKRLQARALTSRVSTIELLGDVHGEGQMR
jgi:hypothetical protein